MTIHSYGFVPDIIDKEQPDINLQIFIQNLDLIINHTDTIITNDKLFFCPLLFAWCSWSYITGDGPLWLGYLLLGWRDGVLTDKCQYCDGKVLIFSLGGSPLSGSNRWSGVCSYCKCKQRGTWSNFSKRVDFVLSLRKSFPESVSKWEEYNGFEFSFGDTGLKPARKKKLVWEKTCDPVNLKTLISALKNGHVPKGNPPNVTKLEDKFKLKFSNKLGGLITVPCNTE